MSAEVIKFEKRRPKELQLWDEYCDALVSFQDKSFHHTATISDMRAVVSAFDRWNDEFQRGH
jgi:hypothetical protein